MNEHIIRMIPLTLPLDVQIQIPYSKVNMPVRVMPSGRPFPQQNSRNNANSPNISLSQCVGGHLKRQPLCPVKP